MDLYCSLFNSPLIKIWSPDCLLPVLGGCDGRWAGLGWAGLLHSVSSKHSFFIFHAVQCREQTSHASIHIGDPVIQLLHRGLHFRAPPWSIWFLETNLFFSLPLVKNAECSREAERCIAAEAEGGYQRPRGTKRRHLRPEIQLQTTNSTELYLLYRGK